MEKSKNLTEEEIKNIAVQLGHPQGKEGIEMGHTLAESNEGMTRNTINTLNLKDDDVVLELGHGNASHVRDILHKGNNITYHGLEISNVMQDEAERINAAFIKNNQAGFHLYDGINIGFDDAVFTKFMTVNTIYFFEEPEQLLHEIYRVLEPGGYGCIAFAQKDFMKDLPVVKYGFTLYDHEEMRRLLVRTPFELVKFDDYSEEVKSKTGDWVNRSYSIATVKK